MTLKISHHTSEIANFKFISMNSFEQLDLNNTYTYADYLTWKFEQTVELIKGQIYKMSPAPRTKHQRLSKHFQYYFYLHFQENKCEFFTAPFDVRLFDKKQLVQNSDEIYTVVQPDLCVICDNSKIDEFGCLGSPDLILEILSPGNSKKEMRIKYNLYQESGVLEYWIADPQHETVQVFVLKEENYVLFSTFISEDILQSHIFPDLKIDLNKVFINQ